MAVRHVITALVVFLSAIAGVAVGDLLLNKPQKAVMTSETELPSYRASLDKQGMDLSFQVGDLFPLESCSNADGAPSNFEDIIMGQPCLIVFSAPGCKRCEELYRSLREAGIGQKKSLRIIACVSASGKTDWQAKVPSGIDNLETVYYDEPTFREKYNLRIIPTVVATDRHGFVQYSQIGFVDRLDSGIMYFVEKMTK